MAELTRLIERLLDDSDEPWFPEKDYAWRDANMKLCAEAVAALKAAEAERKQAIADVYDECESIAVPARATPYEQVEAYRKTIRLLKARAGRGKDVEAPGVRTRSGASGVQAGDIGADQSVAEADLTAARAEIAKYQARLEIDHWFRMNSDEEMIREEIPPEDRDNIPDGITARDETIKILDKQLVAARAEIERLPQRCVDIIEIELKINSNQVPAQVADRCLEAIRALLGEQGK